MSPLEEARAAFLSTKVPPKPITFWRAFCARNEHEILRREDRAPTVDEVQAVEECYECLRAGYEEAGPLRNVAMVKMAAFLASGGASVVVVAFRGGAGTNHCKQTARAHGLTVLEVE